MKKIISVILILSLLAISSTCLADSKIADFNKKLQGTWETYNNLGKNKNSIPRVEKFTYEANMENDAIYWGESRKLYSFLFEEGNGDIWLMLTAAWGDCCARVAISEDGNYLYVLGSGQDFYGVYRKVVE